MSNINLSETQKLLRDSMYVSHPRTILNALISFVESNEQREEECTFVLGLYPSDEDSNMTLIHLAITEIPDFNFSCIGPTDLITEFGDKIKESLSIMGDYSYALKPVLH